MPSVVRALASAADRFDRQARDIGQEFRERRVTLNLSQEHVGNAARLHRNRYGRIERGGCPNVTVAELNRVAAVLGLTASVRVYPAGPPLRDSAHATRLRQVVAFAKAPLTYRLEVPLPRTTEMPELRAWDSMLFGLGRRTAMELEMRLRDIQALRRRIDLKRRDDPTEGFLLIVADTRHNRRILAEFASLFDDLPRLRPSRVRNALHAGMHPPTGMLLI